MTVPEPGEETISNSSMSRRVPGSPSPRLSAVEKPSCMARPTSAMPGPSSRATTETPPRLSRSTVSSTISPSWAYFRMLRASSEIAVAIIVTSVVPKPYRSASDRPMLRAATTSASERITTHTSSTGMRDTGSPGSVEMCEAFLEVEHGRHAVEAEPELHHREGDLGLDADDHCLGAAKPDHLGHRAERPRRERVEHVEHRDVDDDALRAVPAHPLGELVPQIQEVGICQRRLDRCDQAVTLLEDRNGHPQPPTSHRRWRRCDSP